jgi:hypothetical protein
VKSSGRTKKRHRGRHLAEGRRGEPKELTRGDCGSRRKLIAVWRKVFRFAAVALCKGNFFRKIRPERNAARKMTRCAKVAQHKGHGLQGRSVTSCPAICRKCYNAILTTPQDPQCDGMVKRYIGLVEGHLRHTKGICTGSFASSSLPTAHPRAIQRA